jgi:hypothetical protein
MSVIFWLFRSVRLIIGRQRRMSHGVIFGGQTLGGVWNG